MYSKSMVFQFQERTEHEHITPGRDLQSQNANDTIPKLLLVRHQLGASLGHSPNNFQVHSLPIPLDQSEMDSAGGIFHGRYIPLVKARVQSPTSHDKIHQILDLATPCWFRFHVSQSSRMDALWICHIFRYYDELWPMTN